MATEDAPRRITQPGPAQARRLARLRRQDPRLVTLRPFTRDKALRLRRERGQGASLPRENRLDELLEEEIRHSPARPERPAPPRGAAGKREGAASRGRALLALLFLLLALAGLAFLLKLKLKL